MSKYVILTDKSEDELLPQTSSEVVTHGDSTVKTVLDGKQDILTAGEGIEITADNIINVTDVPYSEEVFAYGVRRNINDSSPDLTRIGNMNMHRTLPVQSLMRGCLLDDSGNVVEYLPDDSWEGATTDGSKGQVMVELPEHYRKCASYDDGTMEIWLSLYPLPDYQLIPKMYVGAYQATVQRSTSKLCSVKNEDADYRGGNNNAAYDGTYRSFLGVPASYISWTDSLTYARNRGTAGLNGCGWNSYLYQAHKAIVWLFVVEYATLNIQKDYNSALTSEGYHQGGLGMGVTEDYNSRWNSFNGQYPFIPCGYTDSLGNHSGIVNFTMPEEYGETLTMGVTRYRGIEMLYEQGYSGCCDILINALPYDANNSNALNEVYVCKDPSKFSFTSFADYTYIGSMPGLSSGAFIFPSKIMFGAEGEILPIDTAGSTSTFFCDGMYVSNSVTAATLRVINLGGRFNRDTRAGLFCGNTSFTPSSIRTDDGTRLCFLPEDASDASTITTTADTTNALYPVGVTSSATSTLKRDTSITMTNGQIAANGTSTMWYQGRAGAMVRTTSINSSSYVPIISIKTYDGSWEMGTYTNNRLHFSYITDANYNAANNYQTANITFATDGMIIANTFNGAATKLGTSTVGNATTPIYLSSGTATACNMANYATTANLANAYNQANAAYNQANTAYNQANDAYNRANTANTTANTANATANNALPKAGGTMTGNITLGTSGAIIYSNGHILLPSGIEFY